MNPNKPRRSTLFLVTFFLTLIISLIKPLHIESALLALTMSDTTHLDKRVGALSHFFALLLINVFLADMSTPLPDYILLENIGLIEHHEYLGGCPGSDEIV
jgi:hypothetical protein